MIYDMQYTIYEMPVPLANCAKLLDCGGKRSATPLCLATPLIPAMSKNLVNRIS
jgi:hypothetical protein